MNRLLVFFSISFLAQIACAGPEKAEKAKTGEATTFVYKSDESKQCQNGSVSLDKMKNDLKGITIKSQRKDHDGMMYAQMCGGQTGSVNVYEIPSIDVNKALKKGFKVFPAK